MNSEALSYHPAAAAESGARAAFIRRTYTHLAMAILAFIGIEYIIFSSGMHKPLIGFMLGGQYSWLIVLGLFIGASYIADKWARSETSQGMQYLGLGLYVMLQALIFVPLLFMAEVVAGVEIIMHAGMLTGALFLGLTLVVFTTRKDFSFLSGIISIGGMVALGAIVISIFMGNTLGVLFSVLMVGLAAAAVLYTTSNILKEYRTDQHVAASLALFAAIALMFYYILRILIATRD